MRSRPDASAPAPAWWLGGARLRPPSALSEQACRPPHQQRDHDQINEECAEPGHVVFAGEIADADQACGNERSTDRAEAADRDDDQHVDEIRERERWIEP